MKNPALLVIDIQRGAFDGARCAPIDSPERLVGNARALVEAARAAGRPIVFIQHSEADPAAPFEEGSVHWQLHEALRPEPGHARESVMRKYASSAFEDTDLHARLQAFGADTLVVCGLQSEFCVSNTTRSALALGYRVLLAEDGHGTWPDPDSAQSAAEIRAAVNAALAEAGATPRPTRELAAQLANRVD